MTGLYSWDKLSIELDVPLYLDGRYFAKVFEDYPALVAKPLIISLISSDVIDLEHEHIKDEHIDHTIHEGHVSLFDNSISLLYPEDERYFTLIRLVIEDVVDDEIVARHSNLLIVDPLNKILERFEPLEIPTNSFWFAVINEKLSKIFPEYEIKVDPYHPQKIDDDTFCNAYIIQYAYQKIKGLPINIDNDRDALIRFHNKIPLLYGNPGEGEPDIELGYRGGGYRGGYRYRGGYGR